MLVRDGEKSCANEVGSAAPTSPGVRGSDAPRGFEPLAGVVMLATVVVLTVLKVLGIALSMDEREGKETPGNLDGPDRVGASVKFLEQTLSIQSTEGGRPQMCSPFDFSQNATVSLKALYSWLDPRTAAYRPQKTRERHDEQSARSSSRGTPSSLVLTSHPHHVRTATRLPARPQPSSAAHSPPRAPSIHRRFQPRSSDILAETELRIGQETGGLESCE